MARVACNPSITGIRTSIKMTSGPSSATRSTASFPLTASPITSMSGCALSRIENPDRTIP